MESEYIISEASMQFLANFKIFLDLRRLSITDFFTSFQTVKSGQVSKSEFSSIISQLHIDAFFNFDPQRVFEEFTQLKKSIDISYFMDVFKSMEKYFQDNRANQKRNAQEDVMKMKIGKEGVHKLVVFVRKLQNPFELLTEFDFNEKHALNKSQFNSFLFSTDISEFKSQDVRRIVTQQIFRHVLPELEIKMKKWASLFKIKDKYNQYLNTFNKQKQISLPKDISTIPLPKIVPPIAKDNFLPSEPAKVSKKQSIPSLVSIESQLRSRIVPTIDPKLKESSNVLLPRQEFDRGSFDVLDSPEKQNPFAKSQDNVYNQKSLTGKKETFQQIINSAKQNYPHAMKYYRLFNPNPSEHETMLQFQTLLSQNTKFIDKDNPFHKEGLYTPAREIFKGQKYFLFQQASSVLYREKSRIGMARQIQPKDIIQGGLGDCYFLSSIASIISIYAELIAERFLLEINPANFYAVKLFIDGQWKIIVTDDSFPCKDKKVIYAKPHHNELWAILLQKCWAKVFGSYQAIETGSAKEGFVALTGAPCQQISHQNQEQLTELFNQLQLAQEKRYVATMSGSDYLKSLGSKSEESLGLISGHSYSLLKIIKLSKLILLKLRNPWGSLAWKGDWSFQSSQWTKQLRDKYNYNKNPEDGSFYMSWQDFSRYFGSVVICKLNPTYIHESIRIKTSRNKSGYLKMNVKTSGHYIISIYQQNKRKYHNMIGYQYSKARLIILQKQGGNYHYVGARATSSDEACSVDVELQSGEYILSAKVAWKHWNDYQLTVTSYGVDTTVFTQIDRQIAAKFKQNLIRSYMLKFQGTGKIKSYEKFNFNASCQTNFNIKTGIGFLRIVNDSTKGFKSTLTMTKKGLKVIKPDRQPLQFIITNKFEKIVGFFVDPAGYEYSSSESIVY